MNKPRTFRVWTMVEVDAELSARFAAGEPDTIRDMYRQYGGLVYTVAYRVLGDAGLSEDATQQTFVQAWRSAPTYDPSRALGPWLARIARHAAIDVFRKSGRRQQLVDLDVADAMLVTPALSVERLYELWEVRRALQHLPAQDREVIRLQHYRDLTHHQIAAHLGIPIGTVKSRSFRAHRRLAGLLAHLRDDPEPVGATTA